MWCGALQESLVALGFHISKFDHSLFVLKTYTFVVILLVHVDDILITGSSLSLIQHVIHVLSKKFALKTLKNLHYFLGVEILQLVRTLSLSVKICS